MKTRYFAVKLTDRRSDSYMRGYSTLGYPPKMEDKTFEKWDKAASYAAKARFVGKYHVELWEVDLVNCKRRLVCTLTDVAVVEWEALCPC